MGEYSSSPTSPRWHSPIKGEGRLCASSPQCIALFGVQRGLKLCLDQHLQHLVVAYIQGIEANIPERSLDAARNTGAFYNTWQFPCNERAWKLSNADQRHELQSILSHGDTLFRFLDRTKQLTWLSASTCRYPWTYFISPQGNTLTLLGR
jgi:hypothetical protein